MDSKCFHSNKAQATVYCILFFTENILSYGVKDSIFMSLVLALVLIFVIKQNNL